MVRATRRQGADDGARIIGKTLDRLERRVEILERLPDRVTAVESQIVLLRDEMRSEFSAVRADAVETRRVLTERMESLFDANQHHMRLLHEDLVERIARMGEGRNR